MLSLHQESDEDYCVLFEVHDDVVSLNHSTTPTEADFYQVKTKTTAGNWKVSPLMARKTGKDGVKLSSIIGKLYQQYVRFERYVHKMVIVSNASFDIKMKTKVLSKDLESFCLLEVDDTETNTINDKIKDEHCLDSNPSGISLIHLQKTPLSVLDHETHTEGIVSEFLNKEAEHSILPRPFHKTVRSEVQRRSNKEYIASSFVDLMRHKGITRSDLQAMIDSVPSVRQQNDLYESIRSQLEIENMHFLERKSLMDSVREFLCKRLDQTNLPLLDASNKAIQFIDTMSPTILNSEKPLGSAISHLFAIDAAELQIICNNYSETFLKAIFLVLIYEQKPSTSDSQSKEKSP